ncbi:hypothetical protein ACOBV9_14935 [Pseudoalteromonas espejiana]
MMALAVSVEIISLIAALLKGWGKELDNLADKIFITGEYTA